MSNRSRFKHRDLDYSPSPKSHSTSLSNKESLSDSLFHSFFNLCFFFSNHLKPLDTSSQFKLKRLIKVLQTASPENVENFERILNNCISGNKQRPRLTPSCLSNNFKPLPSKYQISAGLSTRSVDSEEKSLMKKNDLESAEKFTTLNQTFYSKKIFSEKKEEVLMNINKLPVIVNKVLCHVCRKEVKGKEDRLVVCKGHPVCLQCRLKKAGMGDNLCPVCGRKYSDEESIKLRLRMRSSSIDVADSLFKAVSFIDSL
jgi:hypothetical protein